MPPKKPHHHGDLRAALIEASIAILAEEGIGGLTLRSAARRVGVSHAAPKNHFADLRGLLAAVAAEGFRRMHDALVHARDRAAKRGPAASLLAIGPAYVGFAVGAPGHYRAMFHPALDDRTVSEELDATSRATFGVLVGCVAAAQASGEVREGDVVEASLAAWSIVHGLAALAVDDHLRRKGLDRDPVALAATITRHLFEGLAARGGSESAPRPKRGR